MAKSSQNRAPSWGVVCTVNEPPQLLFAFAAHYLNLGAQEVHIYLDRANPEARQQLKTLPRCFVRAPTLKNWDSVHDMRRPVVHVSRQLHNAAHAYARAKVDWLFHCDADEFLLLDQDFPTYLAEVPDEIGSLRVQNLERAFLRDQQRASIFDGVFRVPKRRGAHRDLQLLGLAAEFTKHGFSGHMAGKRLARVGRPYQVGIHRTNLLAEDGKRWGRGGVPTQVCEVARLLHFDGMTPLHWKVKLAKRVLGLGTRTHKNDGPAKQAQYDYLAEHMGDEAAIDHLHQLVQVIAPPMEKTLRGAGLIDDRPFDPTASAIACLPDAGIDFSPDAFDAVIRQREPRVVAALAGLPDPSEGG